MFLRSSPRLFFAFSKTRLVTRCLHSVTLPPIVNRVSQTRSFTTPATQVAQSSLQQSAYDTRADAAMEELLDKLQDILDSHGDSTLEVEYNSGVLTLDLGQHGTYVINKQPPNKQIWLSSPVSGPKRFNFDPVTRQWVDSRDGELLEMLLNGELGVSLGVKCGIDLKYKDP